MHSAFSSAVQTFQTFSDECQLRIAHSVAYLNSVQNVHQLQQHTIKICYEMIRLRY